MTSVYSINPLYTVVKCIETWEILPKAQKKIIKISSFASAYWFARSHLMRLHRRDIPLLENKHMILVLAEFSVLVGAFTWVALVSVLAEQRLKDQEKRKNDENIRYQNDRAELARINAQMAPANNQA